METAGDTSSSSGDSSPAGAPAYLRLSSEVVEKPMHADGEEWGVELPEPDLDIVPPGSPTGSSKSDSEGLSDVEMEGGDVDEGFDEEFEEKDINEQEPPSHFQLGDLDPKELQLLLDDPHLPNLEDFDLGVDVLDSEQPQSILSPLRNSGPYSAVVGSPYEATAPVSPYQNLEGYQNTVSPAPVDLNTNSFYEEYNLSESFGSEDPPSVQSNISALTSASLRAEDMSLALLTSECSLLPDSTVGDADSTVTTTTPYHSPQHATPVLPPVGGLDLSETSHLLSADTLIGLSTSLPSDAIVDTQSMYMFGNGSAHLNFSPNSHQNSVVTLLDSSFLPVSSHSSQTTLSTNRNTLTPPPSAVRQVPVSPSHSKHSASPAPLSPKPELSEEDKRLINMPYYQFRKLLDDPSVAEGRKEEVKNIRRKGRNKMAAKVCRTKKLSLIVGLEKEVEQLRKAKSQISIKTVTLEKEIAELKKRCHNR